MSVRVVRFAVYYLRTIYSSYIVHGISSVKTYKLHGVILIFNFAKNNNIRSHDLVRELCDHAIRNVYIIL